MKKFLDGTGVGILWNKIKSTFYTKTELSNVVTHEVSSGIQPSGGYGSDIEQALDSVLGSDTMPIYQYGVVSQTLTWTGNSTDGYEVSVSNPVMGYVQQSFIDLVTAEGATFNTTSGYFELNGITNIAYDEMKLIYANRTGIGQTWVGSVYSSSSYWARTCFPVFRGFGVTYVNHEPVTMHIKYAGYGYQGATNRSSIVVFALNDRESPSFLYGANSNNFGNSFGNNNTVKSIIGPFNVDNGGTLFYPNASCPKLETFYMRGLKANLSLSGMPSLTAATVEYMISNAGTATITITLHATAYARAIADSGVQTALASKTNVTLAQAS